MSKGEEKVGSLKDLTDEEIAARLADLDTPSVSKFSQLTDDELTAKLAAHGEVDTPIEKQEASEEDMWRGNSENRFLRGLAGAATGPYQLGANIGDMAYGGIVEAGKAVGAIDEDFVRSSHSDDVNRAYAEYDESSKRGQKALGRGDFDGQGLLGAAVSGIGMAPKKIAETATRRIGQGAGYGAIGAGSMPVVGAEDGLDFAAKKAAQVGIGALGGTVVGGTLEAGRKAWSPLAKILGAGTKDPTRNAGRMMNDSVDDVDSTIRTLNDAPKGLTVAQAQLVKNKDGIYKGSRRLAGLQKVNEIVEQPDAYNSIYSKQADDAYGALEATGSPKRIEALEAIRDQYSGPMRETALDNANQATTLASKLKGEIGTAEEIMMRNANEAGDLSTAKTIAMQQARKESNFVGPVPYKHSKYQNLIESVEPYIDDSISKMNSQAAEAAMKKTQLAGMGDNLGINNNPIITTVQNLMRQPEVKGNSTTRKALLAVVRDMKAMAEPDGTFDARTLYELRKSGIDDLLTRISGKNDAGTKGIKHNMPKLKESIDAAIDKAAGGGWREYLETYSGFSREVDAAKIGNKLRESLTPTVRGVGIEGEPRIANFAKALSDEEKLIADATGFKGGAKTLEEAMSGRDMGKISQAIDFAGRKGSADDMAEKGMIHAQARMNAVGDGRLPNALVREIMIANTVLKRMGEKTKIETMHELIRLMKDPKEAAKVMQAASDAEKGALKNISNAASLGDKLRSMTATSTGQSIGADY